MTEDGMGSTAKARRISLVWLVGAGFTALWAVMEWLAPEAVPPAVVISSITAIPMGVALFYDVRARDNGEEPFNPGEAERS